MNGEDRLKIFLLCLFKKLKINKMNNEKKIMNTLMLFASNSLKRFNFINIKNIIKVYPNNKPLRPSIKFDPLIKISQRDKLYILQ